MKQYRTITFFFIILFALQIIGGCIFIYYATWVQNVKILQRIVGRVENDKIYQGGTWDTSLYNSDPGTPYYNAPSSYPLYIITSEGFVIERSKAVKGLLDSSDYKHLIAFDHPQTINTVTNEKWRVLSRAVTNKGNVLGVIVVAFFNPEPALIGEVDQRLNDSINQIASQLDTSKDIIDDKHLDIRDVRYDITFEIVDRYNKVIANHGRTPSFIDPSYVIDAMGKPKLRIIRDDETSEPFMIMSKTVLGKNNAPAGVLVAGQSLQPTNELVMQFVLYATIASLLALLPAVFIARFGLAHMTENLSLDGHENKVKKILFTKKDGSLEIDERTIMIPLNSYQHTMCASLFSAPGKKWKQEHIFIKLGDDAGQKDIWRTAYDASLAINRKTGLKLIMYKDKSYYINPDYVQVISFA